LFCSLSPPTKVANFPQFPVDFLFADFVAMNLIYFHWAVRKREALFPVFTQEKVPQICQY
ncbi:hypothetical protein, partial [uncultured Pseudoflavonifractor sp.]|uniref:hypothetical protein n=1 Tax=uncultured Pseudoflavonifractor sp. TaxID=1221379 RepID=UPI0025E54AFD